MAFSVPWSRALFFVLPFLAGCPLSPGQTDTTGNAEADEGGDELDLDDDGFPDEDDDHGHHPDDDDGRAEEMGFVPEDDLLGCAGYCDIWAQDCPDGEKCVAYASCDGDEIDARKCVPVMGDRTPGESCRYDGAAEATDNCDASSFCWNAKEVDGLLIGTCAAFCAGTPDDPLCEGTSAVTPCGSTCYTGVDGVQALCLELCDPANPSCAEGEACRWTGTGFHCLNLPDAEATLHTAGESCVSSQDCKAGLECANGEYLADCEHFSCCTAMCDLELGDQGCETQPGTSCQPWFQADLEDPATCGQGFCGLAP